MRARVCSWGTEKSTKLVSCFVFSPRLFFVNNFARHMVQSRCDPRPRSGRCVGALLQVRANPRQQGQHRRHFAASQESAASPWSVCFARKLRCLISCLQANFGSPFRSRRSIGIQRCSAGGHRVILVLLLPHPRHSPLRFYSKLQRRSSKRTFSMQLRL